jgi:ABC-type oligopeptide transport system substrate-binding subunit
MQKYIEKILTSRVYDVAIQSPLDHLPKKYMCILFDRREAGESGGRVERITWPDYVRQGKGLLEHLNIESNLRVVQTSVWFDEAQAGNFDLAISAIVSTLMDPSDIFSAWYGKDGPQNYSRWTNAAFHDLAGQIERELDDTKRRQMVRKAEDILENDPPLIPVAYEQIYDAYYNKVKGQNPSTFFGIYDVVRWDQVYLQG